jgi:uncharacterized protein (TIRG00374 family)
LKINRKDLLKLIVSIGITAFVVYYVRSQINWATIAEALQQFNYWWILLSISLSILSHYLRAYRWTLLLNTSGYKPGVFTTYLAIMVCYLGNMIIPRLGEVARCTVLKDHYDIPISFSFGTVITDRLMDLLMLMLLALMLIILQFELLGDYFKEFITDKIPIISNNWPYLLIIVVIGLFTLIYLFKKSTKDDGVIGKARNFIKDLVTGVLAITMVKKQFQFWASTFVIWGLYFLMLYVISFGFGPTDDMSLVAGLAVLVMGSLGMATPVNNGIGAYQAFVASILVLYGIAYEDGIIFAVLSHGSQLFSVIIIGLVSVLILNFKKKTKIREANQ